MAINKKNQAIDIINRHIMYSMGFGIIPIPLVDLTAVTAVQLDMIRQLSELYNQNFDEKSGKAFIASIVTSSVAKIGASVIKALPVFGTLIGGASMSVMAGASTYALGQVCIKHFDENIGIDQIDQEEAKKMYEEEVKTGEKVAGSLKKESEQKETYPKKERPTSSEKETDVYAELLKLGNLRDKGVITEEEFQKMKKELIARF